MTYLLFSDEGGIEQLPVTDRLQDCDELALKHGALFFVGNESPTELHDPDGPAYRQAQKAIPTEAIVLNKTLSEVPRLTHVQNTAKVMDQVNPGVIRHDELASKHQLDRAVRRPTDFPREQPFYAITPH
ncbi:hypothetical protein AmiPiv_06265 [Aminobacter sp. Piv2-1]|uniref:hypothetical protein n=1 Tax=Aminobacter sp. Piv2-1 TaxID=3031122 RepID=UPI00309C85AA